MRRLSSVFGWKRGTRTVRWRRVALSLLQLLSSCCLVMMLLWTADETCRLLTWSGGRTLDALEPLFQKLDLNLEVVNFVCFVGNISNLVGQHFNIGRIVTTWVHCSGRESTGTKVVAHLVHEADDGPHFVLQAANGLCDACNILVVALDHVVVEGDLLFETGEALDQVGLGLPQRRAMLVFRSTH